MTMPTATLRDAVKRFNPQRVIVNGELDAYFVTRPHSPLALMKEYLITDDEPQKILFSGHRGSGKSTELRRLAQDLGDEFFVVSVSAAQTLNLSDINYVDVVLVCAAALFREAADHQPDIDVPEDVLQNVLQWLTSEIGMDKVDTKKKSGSVTASIKAFVLNIEAKFGKESETRNTIRQRLFSRVSELLEHANDICEIIARKTGHPPIIIVEDLDKTDLAHARDLFFDHATTLNSMACHIIYTFPIPLSYSPNFTGRLRDYSKQILLHNVTLNNREDGSRNKMGHAKLKEVVTRRIPETLLAPGALDEIVKSSGGLMRDLMRLVRDSSLLALTKGSEVITVEMVKQVAAEMRNEFLRLLLPEDYIALQEANKTKRIVANEMGQKLLENLSLLEYQNGSAWCDVHPVVLPLLDLS